MSNNANISIPVEDIPSKAEVINCGKHGEYEVRYMEMVNGKALVSRYCPACAEDKKKEEQEEEKRRDMALAMERRERGLLNAGVSKRNLGKVFGSFRVENDGQQKALDASKRFVSNVVNSKPANNMFFIGSVGTGKTHLASSIIQELYEKKSVRMLRVIDLVRILKETWQRGSDNAERDVIDHFGSIDVLVLDEVGIQFGSETERMFMFDIINARYDNMLPTILISNLDINNLKEILGEQAVDRLREDGGKVLVFNWDSLRK